MSSDYPAPATHNLILSSLLIFAAAAWSFLAWLANSGGPFMAAWMTGPLFVATWIIMMIAMMFPSAAPMILMFNTVSAGRKARGQEFVPTWLFVSGYLTIWTIFGIAAYLMSLLVGLVSNASMDLAMGLPRLGGIALLLAGIYQLTPLKRACLTQCRTPFDFVMRSWQEGTGGAIRMGLEHGVYCLGCCWLLFVALFPLGLMNIAAMALITALIFVEKIVPEGLWVGKLAGVILAGYGLLVLVNPMLLPTIALPMPSGAPSGMPGI